MSVRYLALFFFMIVNANVYAVDSVLVINDVPIECINDVAVRYHIPALLIISTLKTENGHAGEANRNTNGTVDYGPMQVNSSWLPKIMAYGFTRDSLQFDACANVEVGAWIMAQEIADGKTLRRGIGNYHSHTPGKNTFYANKIARSYDKISDYLNVAQQFPR